jgi:hypothetical protein
VIVAAHRLKTLSQTAILRTKEAVGCGNSVAERAGSSVIIEPWNEPQLGQKIEFAAIDSPHSQHRSQYAEWCPICSCFGLDGIAPCSRRLVCGRVLRPDAELVAGGRSIPRGPASVCGAKSGALTMCCEATPVWNICCLEPIFRNNSKFLLMLCSQSCRETGPRIIKRKGIQDR